MGIWSLVSLFKAKPLASNLLGKSDVYNGAFVTLLCYNGPFATLRNTDIDIYICINVFSVLLINVRTTLNSCCDIRVYKLV